jgi:hypothetical protein
MSLLIKLTPDVRDRFWKKVDRSGGPDACYWWTASKQTDGYGQFGIEGGNYRAPRIAWVIDNGRDIPDGKFVCHRCDNPACVNPNHLWLGTHTANMRDKSEKGRCGATGARGDRNGSRTKPESRPRGEASKRAILTEDQVRKIRAEYALGGVTQQSLADQYGVSQLTISRIIRRKIWSHVQ